MAAKEPSPSGGPPSPHGNTPVPSPPAAPGSPSGRHRDPEFIARVNAWIDGSKPTPNRFVEYLIGQTRKVRQEYQFIQQEAQRQDAQLQMTRTNAHRLEGKIESYLDDLYAWEKGGPEEAKTPAASAAATSNDPTPSATP